MSVEAVKKSLEDIIGELSALLVKCGERRCSGIEVEIFEQFVVDGSALHGDLEMEECRERDLPVTDGVDPRMLEEVLTVLVHLFDLRQ